MTTAPRLRTGDQLRGELLEAATNLLSERLPVALPSLRETARACGVSATAVYRHFPSQQALVRAIAGQSLSALEAAFGEHGAASGPVADRGRELRDMAVVYVTWAVSNPGAYQLLFEGRDLLEDGDDIDAGIERLQRDFESLLTALPSADRDEKLQAELLWVALHGLVVTRIRKTRQKWRRSVADDAVALVDIFTARH
jgi:AcrR family transcriptional regulator